MGLRYRVVEVILDDDTGLLALEALKSLLSCISRKELIKLLISHEPLCLEGCTYQMFLLWLELTGMFPLVQVREIIDDRLHLRESLVLRWALGRRSRHSIDTITPHRLGRRRMVYHR